MVVPVDCRCTEKPRNGAVTAVSLGMQQHSTGMEDRRRKELSPETRNRSEEDCRKPATRIKNEAAVGSLPLGSNR